VSRVKAVSSLRMLKTKDSPVRSRRYLDWVRTLPCCWCGATPSEASHHPKSGGGSVGMKTCDLRTVPLCRQCHEHFHQRGALSGMNGLQTREWVETQITECLRAYLRESGCV
jgi:hypothetical protein